MSPSYNLGPSINEQPGKTGSRASEAIQSGLSPNGKAVYAGFLYLSIPTILAIAVLITDARQMAFIGKIYTFVLENRASTSIAVQVISIGLGFIQVAAVSRLFSFATRMRLRKVPTTLSVLQFWSGISSGAIQWSLEPKLLALLCIYVGLAAIPGAIWTGSLTPVVTSIRHETRVRIPQYHNMSLLKEWPSEIAKSGPSLRNEKGFFTYSIGVLYGDLLTQSLATATTTDGSSRHHIKYDSSGFMYIGRSFGVGSSVGLVDDTILQNPLAQSYQYQENGYATQVSCGYNTSNSFFHINPLAVEKMLYSAEGYLPDSTGAEYSVYVGHGTDAIVAFGIAAGPVTTGPTRCLGIGAGKSYVNLNATQCKLDFSPSTFNVTVEISGRNITTTRLMVTADNMTVLASATDIDSSGNLTHVAARQMELYTNDLTNIYQSVAGNALNLSISDFRTFVQRNSANDSDIHFPDSTAITQTGIENAIAAMLDDILVGYASAQLMIADDSAEASATVSFTAIRFGKSVYIYLIFSINTFVLLLIGEEAIRTKWWRDLSAFDYNNLAHLAIASSRGGTEVANAMEREVDRAGQTGSWERTKNRLGGFSWLWMWPQKLFSDRDRSYTQVKILLRGKEGTREGGEAAVGGASLGVL